MSAKKQEVLRQPDDTIFVLDIGTRSIIGLVGVVEDEKLNIIAIEAAEHQKRSMIDGQIEDIAAVAKLAVIVKERIEEQLNMKLTRVCVAAAGRALKTERTTHEMEVPEGKAIDDELINQLESGAIEKIEDMLKESSGDMYKQFYLVGYSAIQYYLDEYPISSLLDHHGSRAKADILATFLPSEVVESLYAAMQKAELEVASLTLEPIAAINAAIPENLRLLNLCFVDIGAGTSDIAICKDGNIVGYTMATVAGDEITEALMKEYLIDFNTAEQIKTDLDSKKEIYFTDVMGFEQSLSSEDVLESISGQISQLCKEIAERIREVNGGSPSAVFLGGGGSKLKGVLEGVTEALEMDEKRVAIAGSNFKATSFSKEYDLNNPEYATPLGIAVSTGLNLINDSCHVTLNGRRAKLFRNGQLNVLNVLTMNGYRYRDLFGRSGASLVVTIDGKRTVFYGKPATNSTLMLNGSPAGVDTLVQAGDVLEFIPAQAGEPAQATIRDAVGEDAENLFIRLNGEPADLDTPLKAGDVIVTAQTDEPQPQEDAAETQLSEQQEPEAAGQESEMSQESQEPALTQDPVSTQRPEQNQEPAPVQQTEAPTQHLEAQKQPAPVQRSEARMEPKAQHRTTAASEFETQQEMAAAPQEQGAQQEMKIPQQPVMRQESVAEQEQSLQQKAASRNLETAETFSTAVNPGMGAVPGRMESGNNAIGEAAARGAAPVESIARKRAKERAAARVAARKAAAGLNAPANGETVSGESRPSMPAQGRPTAQPVQQPMGMQNGGQPLRERQQRQAVPAPAQQRAVNKPESGDNADERPVNGSLSASFGNSVPRENVWRFTLNDKPVSFPAKPGNAPYLLLDMLEHSGVDFDNLTSPVVLAVNGMPGVFQQRLRQNDSIIIRPDE